MPALLPLLVALLALAPPAQAGSADAGAGVVVEGVGRVDAGAQAAPGKAVGSEASEVDAGVAAPLLTAESAPGRDGGADAGIGLAPEVDQGEEEAEAGDGGTAVREDASVEDEASEFATAGSEAGPGPGDKPELLPDTLPQALATAPAAPEAAEGTPEGTAAAAVAQASPAEPVPGQRYTADVSDEDLERRWKEEPASLGPLSVGFADAGRLINGVVFPDGPSWYVADPLHTFTTEEVVGYLSAAIEEVHALYPESERLRVGHISRQDGGWLRPHKSHQCGLDVDLSFYLEPYDPKKRRADRFDVARNWALLRSLIVKGDVHFVLVDRRIIKRLYEYARSIGEDEAWLDSVFKAGRGSLVFHARRHRDHFHVRYYSPRAQELGRRVQPLLAKGKPEYNAAVHRVRRGDTLGALALKYDTSVKAIKQANGLKSSSIRAGRTLTIPLTTACVSCPVPPEVIVPARRLPPTTPELLRRPAGPEAASAPEPASSPLLPSSYAQARVGGGR